MKKFSIDHNMRWILLLAAVLLVCIGGLSLLNAYLPQRSDTQEATVLSVSEQNMRLYAKVQVETGVPWVLLCAVDRAEDVTPDLAHVQAVADVFVQAGAIDRGLTIGPITNAADLAGLYTTDRKAIARIAREMLGLQALYLLIENGRFPAEGGTVVDEDDGCRIIDCTKARSPFSGTVTNAADGVVDIECDNGLLVHITGIETVQVALEDSVSAGEALGETTSLFITFWYTNKWIHPSPYLRLWGHD